MTNALRYDPSRTTWIKKRFEAEIKRRVAIIQRRVLALVTDDAFGLSTPTTNAPTLYPAASSLDRLKAFKRWLALQLRDVITTDPKDTDDDWWMKYIQQGFFSGMNRSYDHAKRKATHKDQKGFTDTKKGFMRGMMYNPNIIEQVKILASRVYTDLEGVSQRMQNDLTRILTDGLVTGKHPTVLGLEISERFSKITKTDATRIARTEITRAQAEGQLATYEALGIEDIGVEVEYVVGNNPCPTCKKFEGAVMKVSESHGIIPVHPNCSCAFIPWDEDLEPTKDQRNATKRLKYAVTKALRKHK